MIHQPPFVSKSNCHQIKVGVIQAIATTWDDLLSKDVFFVVLPSQQKKVIIVKAQWLETYEHRQHWLLKHIKNVRSLFVIRGCSSSVILNQMQGIPQSSSPANDDKFLSHSKNAHLFFYKKVSLKITDPVFFCLNR